MKKMFAIGFFPALVLMMIAAPKDARADDETIRIRSLAESQVQIKFFSQDRHVVWPSPNEHYNLDDYAEHEFWLSCISGEQICYGAWVRGNANRYWGTGYDGSEDCSNCCVTCQGGQTKELILRDPVER